ncbi:MAG TPA: FHA domain-containing protein, partial [bacterium]|nr:FHA domain-containing protein [bacterium]
MGKFSSLLQKNAEEGNRFFFVFTEGKYKGGEFSVSRDAQIIIGRDISCDVAIIDAKVSRKHARIWSNNGNTHIEDSNSTNGSVLNGKPLKAGEPVRLSPGDEITIGESTFTFTGTKGTDAKAEAKKPAAPATPAQPATQEIGDRPDAIPLPKKKADPTAAAPAALDAALDSLTNDDERSIPRGVNVAKVSLEKRDLKAAMAQTRFDGSLHAKEGKLSKIEPIELLKVLLQSSTVGILQVKATEPFAEKIDIRLGEKGVTGATSLTNKLFAEEKALTRFLL